MFDLFISSHPILRFLCPSLHPHILLSLCSRVLAFVFASLHPHILRFMFPRLQPCILISSDLCVLPCNLVSAHRLILRLVYCMCLLVPLHSHILRFMYSGCLLISSHPHILRSQCSYLFRKLESDKNDWIVWSHYDCSCYFKLKLLSYYKGALLSFNTSSGNNNLSRQSRQIL